MQTSILSKEQAKILDEFIGVFQRNCKAISKQIIFPSRLLIAVASQENSLVEFAGARKAVQHACFSSSSSSTNNLKKSELMFAALETTNNLLIMLKGKQSRAQIAFEAIAAGGIKAATYNNPSNKLTSYTTRLINKVNTCMRVWGLLDVDTTSLNLLTSFAGVFMTDLEALISFVNNQKKVNDYFKMDVEHQSYQQEEEEEFKVSDSKNNQKMEVEERGSQQQTHFYKSYSETLSSIDLREFTTDKSMRLFSNMIVQLINTKPLTVNELEKISQICGQFLNMCRIRNEQQLGLKIKLAQSFSLLKALFDVFNALNFDLSRMRVHSKHLSNVVELLCLLLKKRLSLMDDAEFFASLKLSDTLIIMNNEDYANTPNFSLTELQQLISFLNVFAYRLLFVEANSDYKRCESKVVKILKQLYERDSRKKFFDGWILTDDRNENAATSGMGATTQQQLQQFNFKRVDEKNVYLSRLLNRIPHVFTFEQRYNKLKKLIAEDQLNQDRNPFQFFQDDLINGPGGLQMQNAINSKNILIQRGNELDDAFSKFHSKNMKALYKITFVDEHGFVEEGIDGGGIIKEFINSVVRQGFDPANGLFMETAENTLMPAPNNRGKFARYVFLGQIVGKAIYENILIEPVFSKVFLNQILEKSSSLEDLQFIDKALYKTLMQLKHTKDNVADYGLSFAIDDFFNGTVELKLNGSNIPVTNENKLEYISLYAGYKLHQLNGFEASAFRSGFASVIDQEWLSMFNHDELQLIISGKFTCFDINDLRANSVYRGYSETDLTIVLFWSILEQFSEQDKAKFLHFVTSCSRPPTLGFKSLNPKFCIQKSTDDQNPMNPEKLPTSSTCMNILKLPDYCDGGKMKQKLLEAIYSGAGFDLS